MNKKTITILIIILITASITGAFWFFQKNTNDIIPAKAGISQKDDVKTVNKANSDKQEKTEITKEDEELNFDEIDTSDWKTYRNEEYGFSVKIPEHWEVSKVEDGYMMIGERISDCALVPTGCPIVVLYDEHNDLDYISLDIMTKFLDNTAKISKWHGPVSMLSGCHIEAVRVLKKNESFSFRSFYEATNLNDELQVSIDEKKCASNKLNPFFNEIVKSFVSIK